MKLAQMGSMRSMLMSSRSSTLPRSTLLLAQRSPTPLRWQSSAALHSDPMTGETTGHNDIDASALVIEANASPKQPPPSATLVFGHSFSDHMLSIPWNSASGWAAPRIHAYAPLTLDPSSVIFHYAPSLFEGMKAYKDVQGKVRLFRPDMNMARMNTSAKRIALPVSTVSSKRQLHPSYAYVCPSYRAFRAVI
jgi:branched-chain amino acid aminotransferase